MVGIVIILIGLSRIGRRNSPYLVGGLLVVFDFVGGGVSFYFVTSTECMHKNILCSSLSFRLDSNIFICNNDDATLSLAREHRCRALHQVFNSCCSCWCICYVNFFVVEEEVVLSFERLTGLSAKVYVA